MGKELFKNIPSKVGDLVKDVRNGRIGLPDLQRPFVWRDNKVRELFDSMLKGYPIGYIMLWESPVDYESKKSTIGDNSKTYEEPKELVIDGQQRLTALVAAMFSVKVKDKNFADREIKISYNPLTREFAVWSQAYEKDTEWISRISDVFLAKEDNSISSLRRRFIKEANEGRSKKELPLLTDEEEDRIEDNINALLNLSDYSLPTLEISYTADEEDVADIFVRVNSGGQSLTENNFIQTLISVYENETSDKINAFAAASRVPAANTSYNTLLAIEPSHLIRMAVGVGFKRARLRYVSASRPLRMKECRMTRSWKLRRRSISPTACTSRRSVTAPQRLFCRISMRWMRNTQKRSKRWSSSGRRDIPLRHISLVSSIGMISPPCVTTKKQSNGFGARQKPVMISRNTPSGSCSSRRSAQ